MDKKIKQICKNCKYFNKPIIDTYKTSEAWGVCHNKKYICSCAIRVHEFDKCDYFDCANNIY